MAVIAVFGASTVAPGTPLYDEARSLGRELAARGHSVATGGYAGLMEAVSAGAADGGAAVIGYTVPSIFPGRSGANEHVNDERPANTLASRIARIHDEADASIALHGSIGTLTELLVAWNSAFVAPFSGRVAKPLIAVGDRWAQAIPYLTDILETDDSMVHVVPDAGRAIELVETLL